ncbi:MAG: NUDIX hydrolase [Candidatus Bathyarchaeota archaeon]|nr:NUDIX hydrolase [Candidatus Bathyarchaeota archaeon]
MMSERDAVKGKVIVSAYAVIEGEGNVILFINEGDVPYNKLWVIPGGYVKPNETVEQTVIREVAEETGLKIAPTKLIGIYDDFLYDKDEPIHHLIIAYKTEVVGGQIIFSQEAKAYRWLSVSEAIVTREVPEVFKRILKDFEKQSTTGVISRLSRYLTSQR